MCLWWSWAELHRRPAQVLICINKLYSIYTTLLALSQVAMSP